jgi:1-acyl-sn-glycerol-3-phosphate acyltransferase
MLPFDALTEINLDDLVASFGWQTRPVLSRLLRAVFRAPAARFARQMQVFDQLVDQSGLPQAGYQTLLQNFASGLRVFGQENIPVRGPALFLSNHPGMVDTLALFAGIARPDLRIIALNRPFLRSLPNTSRHLFFVGDEPAERMAAVKQAALHLRRAAGAVLTFPAGHIEPDAAVYPGALQALDEWTDSAGVFLRFAPETQIVPVFVRGVLWDRAVRHPLTRIKKTREERERLGAALQLLAHILFKARPLHVTLQFAAPLSLSEIGSTDTAEIQKFILARMRALVQNQPAPGTGLSL